MKFFSIAAALAVVSSHKLTVSDEVDDLLAKQDEKDAKEIADKEFNDANSKVNQIGAVSKAHSSSEDEDYMQTVFSQYSKPGTDKRGNPNGYDVLTKDNAILASIDIICKWNDLPEPNARKYLDDRFEKTWSKFDVNNQGFIDVSEAFQFERQLMGTFSIMAE